MVVRILGWPTRKTVDWVMVEYTGLFPETTRRVQTIKVVAIQVALLIIVAVLVSTHI